jgi:aspirochlorine biosynthesis cytochrome P450 monooxygenase
MAAETQFFAFDIMSDLCFGESLGALRNRASHPWMQTFFSSMKESALIGQLMAIPVLMPLLAVLGGALRKAHMEQFKFTTERVATRLTHASNRGDIVDVILEANQAGKGLSREELDINLNVLMVAGTETTASALAGCLFLLALNPPQLEKLKREIRDTFTVDENITLSRVRNLPYLAAVIEESLRIYPPIPLASSRITPPHGASVCGYWVPGNVCLCLVPSRKHCLPQTIDNYRSPTPDNISLSN